jgi:hypothetical protein
MGGPAEDEHARLPRANEPANLNASVMHHRGIGRRRDLEPNRLLRRVVAAPECASSRE